jgi:hypothetical protein
MIISSTVVPFYEDSNVNLFENGLRYYYKVEGFVGGVKVDDDKGTTSEYNVRDPIANKVIHENQLVLRVMNNPSVQVLLKKREGKKCPKCWNEITKKIRYSNCETCNGTGVLGGYHKPIVTRISRSFSQLMDFSNMLDGDKTTHTPIDAWMSLSPLVSPGDIIVDRLNQRFMIDNVSPRTRSQYIIRQVLNLVPLEKGHPAYQVPVDWSGVQ